MTINRRIANGEMKRKVFADSPEARITGMAAAIEMMNHIVVDAMG